MDKVKTEHEERRKTLGAEMKQHQEKARYEDQLARRRYEDQLGQQVCVCVHVRVYVSVCVRVCMGVCVCMYVHVMYIVVGKKGC